MNFDTLSLRLTPVRYREDSLSPVGVAAPYLQDSWGQYTGAVMNFYKHHLGDYAAATQHLSWDEDMAYMRLIRWYYLNEKPLPSDPETACRYVRADTPEKCQAVQAVLREFFELHDDGYHQKRCDEEIAAMHQLRISGTENANKRWRKTKIRRGKQAKWDTQCQPYASTLCQPNAIQIPESTIQTPDSISKKKTLKQECNGSHGEPNAFDKFWKEYPSHQAKKKAQEAFTRLKPDESLLEKMITAIHVQQTWPRWIEGYIPLPATWLNGKRWEDEPLKVHPVANGKHSRQAQAIAAFCNQTEEDECFQINGQNSAN